MSDNREERSVETEALYEKFENLLLGNVLSEEEKSALSQKLIRVIYGDDKGLTQ